MEAQKEIVISAGDNVGGDKIGIERVTGGNVAVGRGASVNVNQAPSQAEEARQQKDLEQNELERAVERLEKNLTEQAGAPVVRERNPYKNLLAYDVADVNRFYGRYEDCRLLLERMIRSDSSGRLAILHSEAGFGKSSLLRAGIMPALVGGEHLPLYVQVTTGPLAATVKQSLLPDLALTPDLQSASLQGFFRQVASILGEGKQVFVLLDQFERFFDAPEPVRQQFVSELSRCLNDEYQSSRWLISIRSSRLGYLNTFQSHITRPFANTAVLGPLTRIDARQAIREPARLAGLIVEDSLSDGLLDDLGDDAIDPARLQIVCHTLVAGLPPGEKQLTMAQYLEAGRAGGILRDYLDTVLKNNLPPADRDNAWRVLEAVDDFGREGVTTERVTARLQAAGIERQESLRLLVLLEESYLIHHSDEGYRLASDKFSPRIKQWGAERAALEQARLESIRQLKRVRDSALRGLMAGAVAFSLAYLITFAGQIDNNRLLGYTTFIRAVPGGLAGLLLILLIDVGMTTYRYRRQAMIWVVGGVAGAAAFALAFWFQAQLQGSETLLLAILEGALWGTVCGLGVVWVVSARRYLWPKVLTVVIAGGLMLWLADSFGHAFNKPDPAILLVVAGAVLAFSLVSVALLSHGVRRHGFS